MARFGRSTLAVLFAVVALAAQGCGKKGPPKVPEEHAPAPIETLNVRTEGNAVLLDWVAPELDASGDELKGLSAFRIFKRVVVKGEASPYQEVAVITPKENAAAATQYSYRDPKVVRGKIYEYQVVPLDLEEVPSLGNKTARVNFSGENSLVQILQSTRREENF